MPIRPSIGLSIMKQLVGSSAVSKAASYWNFRRNEAWQRCLLEEVRLLETFEERASITLGSDVDGELRVGSDAGHVWAIYTVEPLADERADQEYTIRIDCYALVEGEASLVVRHSAPRDLWETESAKGDDLREAIEIGEVAAAASYDEDRVTRTVDMLNPRIWIPRAA